MKRVFRSRGIRVNKEENGKFQGKIYYEAEDELLLMYPEIKKFSTEGILEFFEYSETEQGIIDTLNFHNNLHVPNTVLYELLNPIQRGVLQEIPEVFGREFRNYTTGYRVNGTAIVGFSFYFYPTIWKETRFGIRGITEPERIQSEIQRFCARFLKAAYPDTISEIMEFAGLMDKFKGVSVSFKGKEELEFKLYGKMTKSAQRLCAGSSEYGECVLMAQRIRGSSVVGYNVYYLQ